MWSGCGARFDSSATHHQEGVVKFIRFQGVAPILGAASKLGIFQLAYQLKHSPETSHNDDRELRHNLDWLETHLCAPKILDKSEHYRAICWFKDSAHEPLKRIWALKYLLKEYGILVDRIKSENPGLIIYQDGWQVAAKPLRSQNRG
jgi:hypothetical protein